MTLPNSTALTGSFSVLPHLSADDIGKGTRVDLRARQSRHLVGISLGGVPEIRTCSKSRVLGSRQVLPFRDTPITAMRSTFFRKTTLSQLSPDSGAFITPSTVCSIPLVEVIWLGNAPRLHRPELDVENGDLVAFVTA